MGVLKKASNGAGGEITEEDHDLSKGTFQITMAQVRPDLYTYVFHQLV